VVQHDNRLYNFRHGEGIISRSLHKKIINQIFPVHDPNILGELKRGWIKNLKQLPPIDGLFNYFGSKIGLYFAWLQHYTCALGVHVLVGILFWIFQSRNQSSMKEVLVTSYDDVNFVLFSFFNVIWATLYLKSWKRRSCELAYAWRTLNTQKELLSEPRPLFKGEEIINDITDKPDLYYAPWKRYVFMCLVSIPVIAICLLVCFMALIWSLRLQDWWDEEMENFYFIPKVFLAATIPILNFLYEKIAVKLNYMENYRSEESHNNNLSLKLILFQFINSFLSLFYVAFYLQDMEKLRDLLTAILITRQVTGSIKETILPFATKYLQLFSIGLRDPLDPSSFDPTKIRADISQIKQIEREGASPVYKGTHEDYMEILIQFGYVTFFSSVYPLAGFLALLNNIFEIRGDALKLCIAYQRPFGERVPNIGVWQVAMECMGTIAIIVNCALIGQCGQIFKFLPSMSEISMILFIVGLEHVVLFLKMLITHLVPDIPSWVEKELTRIEHKRQELERKSETEKIDRSI
jgi:anoctamin-8